MKGAAGWPPGQPAGRRCYLTRNFFEKFLIDREGKVVGRWASTSKPENLEKEIVKEIEKKA